MSQYFFTDPCVYYQLLKHKNLIPKSLSMNRSLVLALCSFFSCIYAFSSPKTLNGGGPEDIRSNLYVKQGTGAPILLDGDLTEYDASFSNNLDGMDARKMSNFSENLGMLRSTYVLVVERRATIGLTDTIFYKMWQMQQRPYQLEFITNNLDHPGLEGYLEDSYLKTSTPIDLNGRTTVDFTITSAPASAATDRFRIIFKTIAAAPLPLTFTSFDAYRQNKLVKIDWKTENETNMTGYQVEKSIDGIRFSGVSDIKANNFPVNSYSWVDIYPSTGNNYYRILSTENDGKRKYSEVLKVLNEKGNIGVTLYPNPVTNHTFHIQLDNQPSGVYEIRLLSNTGQLVFVKKIQHPGGNINQTVETNQSLKKGVYQLEVITPSNTKKTEKVIF